MDRRTFIEVFAGGLIIARTVAEAQPAVKVYQISFLTLAVAESAAAPFRALSEGLRDLGYIEGHNIIFERRYANGEGAGPDDPAVAAAARGRGDPMMASGTFIAGCADSPRSPINLIRRATALE